MKYILASGMLLSGALYAADLTGIEHGVNTAGGYQLVFKNVGVLPTAFNTDNPAAIVLDFSDTTSAIAGREVNINANGIYDVDVLQGQNKTRAVVNLASPAAYTVALNGYDAILRINTLSSGLEKVESSAASSQISANNAFSGLLGSNSVQPVAEIKQASSSKQSENLQNSLSPIFRSSQNKNGALSFNLPNANTVVDVRNEGDRVVAEIVGYKIANEEQKRLDVSDYATPVQYADIQRTTKGTKITLTMSNEPYEFVTYQNGSLYTIDIIPSDSSERANIAGLEQNKLYKGEPLSLNFQDIEVRAVLQIIAEFTKNNIVVSDSVGGSITLRLNNVPWDQALDIILRTKGLDKREDNGVIYVAPASELLQSEIAQLQGHQEKQRLLPAQTQLIQVKYAKAEDLATIIEASRRVAGNDSLGVEDSILSEKGSVTVDARTNTLLVSDVPAKIQAVRDLVAKLDEPVRQVLVDARLVLTQDNFAKDFGVKFGASFSSIGRNGTGLVGTGSLGGADNLANQVIGVTNNGSSGITPPSLNDRLGVNLPVGGPSYGLAILGADFLVDLELSALQTEGQIEIVSSPRVVTQDGAQAKIASGTQVPQPVAQEGGGRTIEYKDALLSLDVTPRIAPDDMVDMQLEITNDSPGVADQTPLGPSYPINKQQLETQVLVDNGETIVLGGVYQQSQRLSTSKVPLLGDLPLIGNAFKSKQNNYEKSELLIFVTPRIIDKRLAENDKFSNLRD